MPVFVKMYLGSNFGGTVAGNWGTYQQASDGTASVDTRDVAALLAGGAVYLQQKTVSYGQTPGVKTPTLGQLVASASLANGSLAIANQPDVPRQVAVVVGETSPALSAGTISVSYTANDGTTQTDVVPVANTALNSTQTTFLSKGVVHMQTPTVAGVSGGGAPFVYFNTTGAISVPVDPNAKDITFLKETIDTGDEAIGTVSTSTLATITPTTTPNNTHTYGFMYSFYTPDV